MNDFQESKRFEMRVQIHGLNFTTTVESAMEDAMEGGSSRNVGMSIGFTILFLSGLTNAWVLYVICKTRELWTPNNILIFNHCLANFLLTMFLPFVITREIVGYWALGSVVCHFNLGISALAKQAIAIFVATSSLERFYGATRIQTHSTYFTAKNTCILSGGVWVATFILILPCFIFAAVTSSPLGHFGICEYDFPGIKGKRIYLGSLILFLFLGPTLLTLFLFALVLRQFGDSGQAIRKFSLDPWVENAINGTPNEASSNDNFSMNFLRNQQRKLSAVPLLRKINHQQAQRRDCINRNQTRIALLISFSTLLSWIPHSLMEFGSVLGVSSGSKATFMSRLLINLARVLPYAGTAFVPAIYIYWSQKFRESFCGNQNQPRENINICVNPVPRPTEMSPLRNEKRRYAATERRNTCSSMLTETIQTIQRKNTTGSLTANLTSTLSPLKASVSRAVAVGSPKRV